MQEGRLWAPLIYSHHWCQSLTLSCEILCLVISFRNLIKVEKLLPIRHSAIMVIRLKNCSHIKQEYTVELSSILSSCNVFDWHFIWLINTKLCKTVKWTVKIFWGNSLPAVCIYTLPCMPIHIQLTALTKPDWMEKNLWPTLTYWHRVLFVGLDFDWAIAGCEYTLF